MFPLFNNTWASPAPHDIRSNMSKTHHTFWTKNSQVVLSNSTPHKLVVCMFAYSQLYKNNVSQSFLHTRNASGGRSSAPGYSKQAVKNTPCFKQKNSWVELDATFETECFSVFLHIFLSNEHFCWERCQLLSLRDMLAKGHRSQVWRL